MQFEIRRIHDQQWSLVPLSGTFEGLVIGTVDGVCLRSVVFSNKVLVGEITAIWGLDLDDKTYRDIETLKALRIGRSFDMRASIRTTEDFDGYVFARNKACRMARHVVAIGSELYVEGAQ